MRNIRLIKRTESLALSLRGVTKRFGSHSVLQSLDLAIPAGQFVAIVGRSGCGKSTLLRLLAGLETASSGELQANRLPLSQSSSAVRLMFQEPRLLPWKTVIENVGLGLKGKWREEAQAVLAAVGLADKAEQWPETLSGGQKQRVALARALIHRPGLLLLDEPLGALDALTRLEMQQLLIDLWQTWKFTVVLVTHDVSEAVTTAQRVLMLDSGVVGMDVDVAVPYPRTTTQPAIAQLEQHILQAIMQPEALPTEYARRAI
ncbi:ATP-binding cassette domain-containing protein [Rosenbergiella australiborealis]|uniref:ATP-binding cassette domain-containing protein n=1 Tax=Rosenbergiella australiborealis TaxID=1544696 RepID=A0ABS5T603_9GAMM|nr:ATP-binding cassette domain-containing protein [Rosenbergiella australiborealis]MBT0727780.1 ATP-binding cassette domain-containing protein [Rosenbergiella australiborealis]